MIKINHILITKTNNNDMKMSDNVTSTAYKLCGIAMRVAMSLVKNTNKTEVFSLFSHFSQLIKILFT